MKKAKYLHKKKVTIPLYRGALVIILTNDIDSLKKLLPGFDADDLYAHALIENWRRHQGFVVVLNFDNDFRAMYHGVIAHEAIHAAHLIAEARGFDADFENDEPVAYLVEWITDEIYKFMTKHKMTAK